METGAHSGGREKESRWLTYLTAHLLINAHSYRHLHTNAHICTHTKYIECTHVHAYKIHQGRRIYGKRDVLRGKRQGWLAAERDSDGWWCCVYGACGLALITHIHVHMYATHDLATTLLNPRTNVQMRTYMPRLIR